MHTFHLSGLQSHGKYDILVEQYALDSTLRSKGNVFVSGDSITGKLAPKSVAEYRFDAQENSPIEITSKQLDTQIKYYLEIFDADGNRQFADSYYTTNLYRYAFTPQSSGTHTFRLSGIQSHGKYDILIEQYNLDSILRGNGNIFVPGDSLTGKLAPKSVAEYRFDAQENSPIEITSKQLDTQIKYYLEIFDADGNRQFADSYYTTNLYRYAFTPQSNGTHTVRLSGIQSHGKYDILIEQYNLDSTLRGNGNIFVPGDSLTGKLAPKSVAEYRFDAQENSPIEITSKQLDTQIKYYLEIFDADGNRQFADSYYTTNLYRYAFTPQSSGTHTVRLSGIQSHGKYDILIEQYNLDSTLRGDGNLFSPGDSLTGKLAPRSVAEYRFNAQENSPIEITSKQLNTQIKYYLEIFDADGNRQFADSYYTTNFYRYAFTPQSSGTHTVRLSGIQSHGKYDILIEQYNLDSTLRGDGNLFSPGDSLTGKLAPRSVAEYRFNAQENSPIEITSKQLDTQIKYYLEIFDADGNRQFADSYYTTNFYRYAFTPQSSGTHTVRLSGIQSHGKYDILIEQYNLDSTLRGDGNIFTPGDRLTGKLAPKSVAEYHFDAQENSPIEITSKQLDRQIKYYLEIFDDNGNRQFADSYYTTNLYRYAFTPKTKGRYKIRITGLDGHGRFNLETN
ncbi:hypothetical protein JCM19237_441 [Photobacterium aphoticum]|uniref:Uncharacterized protein n=1 Tax=Photobacterium aphoticum TaxID=754436 RepID=A0A090QR18_9GAMM|nr:hypothetical protein JCM19237_441 [Photobacterium aphoticum]